MKYLFFLLSPVLAFGMELSITIDKIKLKGGSLFIGLYKDKNNFTKLDKVYKAVILNVNDKTLKTIFEVPKGLYAISVFHDEDENQRLDTNFFGIPKEGFGFSNNPKISFSKPSFEECSFTIKEDTTITIHMAY